LFGFAPVEGGKLVAGFGGRAMTSDAGAVLRGATDRGIRRASILPRGEGELLRIRSTLQVCARGTTSKWLHHQWGEPAVSIPDKYRRGFNAIGDQAAPKKIIDILEGQGWPQRSRAASLWPGCAGVTLGGSCARRIGPIQDRDDGTIHEQQDEVPGVLVG
jgi:hypothetical protein